MQKDAKDTPLMAAGEAGVSVAKGSEMVSKRKKRRLRTRHKSSDAMSSESGSQNRIWAKLLSFLAGSGLLLAVLTVAYRYFDDNVSLEFIQPVGRAYEFEFTNNTPFDKVIISFRVAPPTKSQFIYQTTEDTYAYLDEKGNVILPESFDIYVPAAEFAELDGQVLNSDSSITFRVPPLSSRQLLESRASIVDVTFELESENGLLRLVDNALFLTRLRSKQQKVRFLVIDGYWTPSAAESLDEAIRVFCRENDDFGKTSTCEGTQ